ncbi:MAG: UDP-N-acetylmuramoyl-L-alanine--D-glutamate ligase [Candidatus Pacebacteria bacterium]|nr:UDP-N-acetylmuramoyl-L-alanine--D-glutamate ligase [Candidatus Paceibacterota bacterium]
MSNFKGSIEQFIKDKKVLVVGLGSLGGGVATCRWLIKHGAKLTITDLRNEKELKNSLLKLKPYLDKIKLALGRHQKNDFRSHDIIVLNPGVKIINNPYFETAQNENKVIENEMTLFFKFSHRSPIIAVTGTRGKTTVANWVGHFLKTQYPQTVIGGNNPDNPVLSFLDKTSEHTPVVLEISSFQLELLKGKYQAPKIAVITNLFPDHLNRHRDMKDYAKIKANIFHNQTKDDFLILNYDDKWTNFFLSLGPKSQVYFASLHRLAKNKNGVFFEQGGIYFQENKEKYLVLKANNFLNQWGEHNLKNLMFALLAAKLFGLSFNKIKKTIPHLPHLQFRQEIICKTSNKTIINDSNATSPEATIAALKRFSRQKNDKKINNLILIIGGTDKNLRFDGLAQQIKKTVLPQNLVILNGSASKKLIQELIQIKYSNNYFVFESLGECFSYGLTQIKKNKKNIILFSPGAASFEKFQNEFDRGEKFNQAVSFFSNNLSR